MGTTNTEANNGGDLRGGFGGGGGNKWKARSNKLGLRKRKQRYMGILSGTRLYKWGKLRKKKKNKKKKQKNPQKRGHSKNVGSLKKRLKKKTVEKSIREANSVEDQKGGGKRVGRYIERKGGGMGNP